jgi:hypothetical protein
MRVRLPLSYQEEERMDLPAPTHDPRRGRIDGRAQQRRRRLDVPGPGLGLVDLHVAEWHTATGGVQRQVGTWLQ